jgi:hypothetical protein
MANYLHRLPLQGNEIEITLYVNILITGNYLMNQRVFTLILTPASVTVKSVRETPLRG